MIKFSFSNKQSVKFFDLLFWLFLGVIFPLAGGVLSLTNIVYILVYLSAVYYIGELSIGKVESIRQVPFLFKAGIYIIIGGILSGIIFLLVPIPPFVLIAVALLFYLDLIFSKRVSFVFSWRDFVCLIPFFIILFQTFELAYATTERYNHSDGDYFYYTALTESIKTNHSISDAIFHKGIPINYAVLPFIAPAQLADFANISSQIALWGVYSKLIPIICLGLLSYTIVKLYESIFSHELSSQSFFQKQLLSSFLLLFLGPLHFLKLFQFDLKQVLFLGEGYILPIGSPGFSLGMLLAGIVMLLIFSKLKWTILHKVAIIVLLSLTVISKVALFLPLAVLLGILSVFWMYQRQYKLFFVLLITLPLSVLLYLVTSGSQDSILTLTLTTNGYFHTNFVELAHKYGITGSATKKVLIMFLISITMWLSLKLLIFLIAGISVYKRNFVAFSLLVAGILTFIISCFPGFFINAYGATANGVFLFDARFDMGQFVRGSIFLISIITYVFVLYLVYEHKSNLMRKLALAVVSLWMLVISFGFFAFNYTKPAASVSWYKEAQKEFMQAKPQLMAMIGNGDYSGQTLSAAGVHPWYCTGLSSDAEGHVMSRKAHERNIAFQRMFDTSLSLAYRKSLADSIKNVGVDCVVASPWSLNKIKLAEKDSILKAINHTRWLYLFN